ncbi:radical SAM protein [Candidatus Dojkabacteria bacterium]|nr:radical SAM protein [Candidatus Dojkabacteria bacterium]
MVKSNRYKIPKYSEDQSISIGRNNLYKIRSGKGKLVFTGAYIHLAPICNFRCKGCFTHMGKLPTQRLAYKEIKYIVDFAKGRGAESIVFAGAGEPTLDPEFDRICNYISSKKLNIVLFTNLTTLKTKEQAKKYLKSGPVIGKLYSLNEEKYNKITSCKGAYKSALKGLEFLLNAKKELEKPEVTLAIDSYISRDNYKDLPDLLRFCRKKDIIPYFEAFIELGQDKKIVKKLALGGKELAELFLELQRIDKEEFAISTQIHPWSRNYGQDRCRKATHMFSVRENGDICICVCTERKVGNISDCKNPYESLESTFSLPAKHLLQYLICDNCSKTINPTYLNQN